MKLTIKPCAFLFFALIGFGCVSAPRYPENWAPGFPEHGVFAKAGETCSLTGSYADAGDSPEGQDSSAAISLFRTLFPNSTLPTALMPDSVTLRGPENGAIEVIAWKDNKPVETGNLRSYVCMENGLINANPGASSRSGGLVVTVWSSAQDNFLYRGTDGWLVLKQQNLMIVIPWFQWKTEWYRFRPITRQPNMQ